MKTGVINIKIIVCTDDRGGYLFNHRRVSCDRLVTEDILSFLSEDRLWIAPYTAGLFQGLQQENISVEEDYLNRAGENDYCLIEDKVDIDVWNKAKEIVLYKWNRVYPYDTAIPGVLINESFHILNTKEFMGNSHEKITKEVYSR